MQTQVSSSAYQARAILGAWQSGDNHRLGQELDRVNGMQSVDAAEQERLELLSEIARELRAGGRSGKAVYGSLLEHLASTAQPSNTVQTTQSSGYGRAATATALQ